MKPTEEEEWNSKGKAGQISLRRKRFRSLMCDKQNKNAKEKKETSVWRTELISGCV
jgi:hypothetical protein